ncbi:MAG: hypothetical protein ACRDSK_16130 [Actinophytocola sp.]|uniref:hypothetical protein n=1 Tax=Actinophytocola sp. TaxID=1872138 RepID=UPI003D6BFFCD
MLLGVLIACVAFSGPLTVVLVLCAVAVCLLLAKIVRDTPDVLRHQVTEVSRRWGLRKARWTRTSADLELHAKKRLLKVMAFGLLIFLVAPVVVWYLSGTSVTSAVSSVAVTAAVLVACATIAGALRWVLLVAMARTPTLRPRKLTRREKLIDEQQDHQTVIYQRPPHRHDERDPLDFLTQSEVPSPFLGSGKLVNRWLPPIGVQLLRPGEGSLQQREYDKPPFKAHRLVETLRRELTALGSDSGAESLPSLRVRDRIYAAGTDLPVGSDLLRSRLGKREIREIIDDHRRVGDHFLETSIPIYDGKLIATVLIRVSVKGRSMSLDVATCALTRIPDRFQVVDRYKALGLNAMLRWAARGVLSLPADVVRIWQLLELPFVLGWAWWARRDRMARPRRRPIGPEVAIRQEVTDAWDNAEQDHTTIHDHMKIVEQRILKATEDFLREHEVDTSMFEKKATSIMTSTSFNMVGSTLSIEKLMSGISYQTNNGGNDGGAGA